MGIFNNLFGRKNNEKDNENQQALFITINKVNKNNLLSDSQSVPNYTYLENDDFQEEDNTDIFEKKNDAKDSKEEKSNQIERNKSKEIELTKEQKNSQEDFVNDLIQDNRPVGITSHIDVPTCSKRLTNKISHVLNSSQFLSIKYWTVISLGLLIHDGIVWGLNPDKRYGTSEGDVLLGLKVSSSLGLGADRTNQQIWLNHLGSDDVNDVFAFWAITLIAISSPIAEFLIELAKKNPQIEQEEAEKQKTQNKCKTYSWNITKYSSALYAYFRYLQLFAQKIIEAKIFYKDKNNCQATFEWIAGFSAYMCSICGNWSDIEVYPQDINSSQMCLDTLMRSTLPPTEKQERLLQLAETANFDTIDFTQQAWFQWKDEVFENFLATLKPMVKHVDLIDFSMREEKRFGISTEKLRAIINFIQNLPATKFKINNLLLEREQALMLAYSLRRTLIEELEAENTVLGHDGALGLKNSFPSSNLKSVDLSNNQMIYMDLISILDGFKNSTVTEINFSSNAQIGINKPIFTPSNINGTLIHTIALSGVPLTKTALNFLGDVIDLFEIVQLRLDSCKLTASGMEKFNLALFRSKIRVLSISNNKLLDDVFSGLINSLPSSLEVILLRDIEWTENTINALVDFISRSQVQVMVLANNNFNSNQWLRVMKAVAHSTIKVIDISHSSDVNSEAAIEVGNYYRDISHSINSFNLSYCGLEGNAGSQLLSGILNKNVTSLNFSGNDGLSSEFANTFLNHPGRENLQMLDISYTGIDGYQLNRIVKASSGTPLQVLSANGIQCANEDAENIAQNLISSYSEMPFLGEDELSKDQYKLLGKAEPKTNLTHLSLEGSVKERGGLALQRAVQRTNINNGNLRLGNISRDNIFNVANDSTSSILPVAAISVFFLYFLLCLMYKKSYLKNCKKRFGLFNSTPANLQIQEPLIAINEKRNEI